ncbi:MAG: branched-chain-amino-acid transaminase [Verrucomicrobiae bacterium]|nr:branched-chain-amino-acid transaminase [Verrucomicrobiae bacterium]
MRNRKLQIYIDGKFYSKRDAKVSVFDHGLLYGDGVFEGIRIYNGRIFRFDEHLDRLYASAKAIMLKVPLARPDMSRATVETCRRNGLRDGYIRLLVTRGVGNLGLSPSKCPKASVIIIADTIELYPPEVYHRGMRVITTGTWRMPNAVLSPAVKSLNYLNNIMARIEASNAGADEGLMLNAQGYVAECTGDNIFTLKGNLLQTPPISAGALGGITRAVAMDLAAGLGLKMREAEMTRYDIFAADECFLTGTAAEIVPVVWLDGRQIGNGKPGPITTEMMRRYRELTQREGTPIYE